MWDVKSISGVLLASTGKRFTLTMWDVKPHRTHSLYHSSLFYLNYVGCKGIF